MTDALTIAIDEEWERRASAAMLSEEEVAQAKKLDVREERRAAALAGEKAKRAILGAQLEADARKEAAGRYLVKFFDLGSLLPEADPATLPGGGVLVVRSPPTHPVDVLEMFYRELETVSQGKSLPNIYTDLVCSAVVRPAPPSPLGDPALRIFLESSIGRGTSIPIGNAVTALGGIAGKVAKRGQ